jgi:hypothetical protein
MDRRQKIAFAEMRDSGAIARTTTAIIRLRLAAPKLRAFVLVLQICTAIHSCERTDHDQRANTAEASPVRCVLVPSD